MNAIDEIIDLTPMDQLAGRAGSGGTAGSGGGLGGGLGDISARSWAGRSVVAAADSAGHIEGLAGDRDRGDGQDSGDRGRGVAAGDIAHRELAQEFAPQHHRLPAMARAQVYPVPANTSPGRPEPRRHPTGLAQGQGGAGDVDML